MSYVVEKPSSKILLFRKMIIVSCWRPTIRTVCYVILDYWVYPAWYATVSFLRREDAYMYIVACQTFVFISISEHYLKQCYIHVFISLLNPKYSIEILPAEDERTDYFHCNADSVKCPSKAFCITLYLNRYTHIHAVCVY